MLPTRSGNVPASIDRTTRLTLCFADAAQPASRQIDVVVADSSVRLGAQASCGTSGLSATLSVSPEQAKTALPVAALENHTARAIVVKHGASSTALQPKERTGLFKGTSYAGDWVVEIPLVAGETCEAASNAIAGLARIVMFFDCGGES